MKKNIIVLVSIFIVIFMISSATAIPVVKTLYKTITTDDENLEDDILFVDPNINLRKGFHKIFLERSLPNIDDPEIKQIVIEIITVINNKGYATSNDIRTIIENSEAEITRVYGMSQVKTTAKTGGELICLPGFIRSQNYDGCYVFGSYVQYFPRKYGYQNYGWHLTIRGEETSEDSGKIIGYFGYVKFFMGNQAGADPYFLLNGFGILIFHEEDKAKTQQYLENSNSGSAHMN